MRVLWRFTFPKCPVHAHKTFSAKYAAAPHIIGDYSSGKRAKVFCHKALHMNHLRLSCASSCACRSAYGFPMPAREHRPNQAGRHRRTRPENPPKREERGRESFHCRQRATPQCRQRATAASAIPSAASAPVRRVPPARQKRRSCERRQSVVEILRASLNSGANRGNISGRKGFCIDPISWRL